MPLKPWVIRGLCCLLLFRSPDGTLLFVERDAITVFKPIPAKRRDRLAPKTHAVIYLGVKATGFGIAETVDEVMRMIDH
jgi:hypothetical protein